MGKQTQINILRSISDDLAAVLNKHGYLEDNDKDPLTDRALMRDVKKISRKKNQALWSDLEYKYPGRESEFVIQTTSTDTRRLKYLIKDLVDKSKTKGKQLKHNDITDTVRRSGLCRESRIIKIVSNEGHILKGYNAIDKAWSKKYTRKRWVASSGACEVCMSLSGQTVPIDGFYSNGSFIAHAHPFCICHDEFLP